MKIGDVVRLKSGGPKMVVREARLSDVVCEWFDKTHALRGASFVRSSLQMVSEYKPLHPTAKPMPKIVSVGR